MAESRIKYRRDPRHQFPRGTTSISISAFSHFHPEISNVSAAGLAFTIGADAGIAVGDELAGVTLRLGACTVKGDLSVRNVAAADSGRLSCGCLFYPETPVETERWMIVVNTVDAVLGTARCS